MEEPEGEASSQGNLVWSRASEAVGWDKAWVEAGKRLGRTFAIMARYLDFIQSAMESLKDGAAQLVLVEFFLRQAHGP